MRTELDKTSIQPHSPNPRDMRTDRGWAGLKNTDALLVQFTHTGALGFLFPLIILRRACTSLSKEINAKAQEPQIHRHKRDNTSNSATCSITHSTREPACLPFTQATETEEKEAEKEAEDDRSQAEKKEIEPVISLPAVCAFTISPKASRKP